MQFEKNEVLVRGIPLTGGHGGWNFGSQYIGVLNFWSCNLVDTTSVFENLWVKTLGFNTLGLKTLGVETLRAEFLELKLWDLKL